MAERLGPHGESFEHVSSDEDEHTPHPVQDPVEAEHMARAMDPHYTRASKIDEVATETGQSLVHRQQESMRSRITEEELARNPELTGHADTELNAYVENMVSTERAFGALEKAARHERKAGDAAGEIASSEYRREKHSEERSAFAEEAQDSNE